MSLLMEPPGLDTFGARLALLRHHMGAWNVKRMAAFCGIGEQNWRNWEAGHRCQNYEPVCRQIATRTGCPLDWLMRGTNSAWSLSSDRADLPFHPARAA